MKVNTLFLLALGMVINHGWTMEKESTSSTSSDDEEKRSKIETKYRKMIEEISKGGENASYFVNQIIQDLKMCGYENKKEVEMLIKFFLAKSSRYYDPKENDTRGLARKGSIHMETDDTHSHSYARSWDQFNQDKEAESVLPKVSDFKNLLNAKQASIDKDLDSHKIEKIDESLSLYKYNDAEKKLDDSEDFTPSIYQYLRYYDKINTKTDESKQYKIHDIVVHQDFTLSTILESWCKALNEKKFSNDKLSEAIIKNINLCVDYYNIAYQDMKANLKEKEINPLLYRHCVRLYECINSLIFTLLAHHNCEIKLDEYQQVMKKKDSSLYEEMQDIEFKDYPATSGCDSFIKSNKVLPEESLGKVRDEFNCTMYFEYSDNIKKNKNLHYINFISNPDGGGEDERLKNNMQNIESIKKTIYNISNILETQYLIIDTTLDPILLEEKDNIYKEIMKILLNFVKEGKLIIIESKSLQKFAQLGCGKLKLGNIRVISKKGDLNINKIEEKLKIYAQETLKGSRDEIDMMMFMTNSMPNAEEEYVNTVARNVMYTGVQKLNPFFIYTFNDVLDAGTFPETYTFGFAFTTKHGNRISFGLEPKLLIKHYMKNKMIEENNNFQNDNKQLKEMIEVFKRYKTNQEKERKENENRDKIYQAKEKEKFEKEKEELLDKKEIILSCDEWNNLSSEIKPLIRNNIECKKATFTISSIKKYQEIPGVEELTVNFGEMQPDAIIFAFCELSYGIKTLHIISDLEKAPEDLTIPSSSNLEKLTWNEEEIKFEKDSEPISDDESNNYE